MTRDEFHNFRDIWTENATQAPFVELGENNLEIDNSDALAATE